ncbi:MAG: methyl-accepting chemotaxis protein [Desulfovibrio sp.]|uniref:methyl-accepting chemotaxis protein n=1 Tax=Desulfovibrio sp. 7SRBS1 TaxID=3378064 RepID=UPI003B3CEE31
MTLKLKLVLFTLLVVVLPLLFIGYHSLDVASTSLEYQSFNQLQALSDAKKMDFENRSAAWFKNVAGFTGGKEVYNTLTMLSNFFEDAKPGFPVDTSATTIDSIVKFALPRIAPAVEKLGFSDALLINDKGRVYLTVKQNSDWGADLLQGSLAQSNLSKALREALKGEIAFADLEKYPPQNNNPAAFIVAPLRGFGDEVVGALAFQVPMDNVNALMNAHVGMGKSGCSFLVGPDGLLRSDMNSEQTSLPLTKAYAEDLPPNTMPGVQAALEGKSGTDIMTDSRGKNVLAAYTPVQVDDDTWALISKIDQEEAFAPVDALRKTTIIAQVGALLVVLIITLFVLRSQVFRPLSSVDQYAERVAEGDYSATVDAKLPPELARVRDSLTSMVENIKTRMEEVDQAKEVAQQQAEAAQKAQQEAEAAQLQAVRAKSEGLTMAADTIEHGIAEIANAVNELSQAMSNTNNGASMQKDRTLEIATAMDEMTATVHEMAANSHDAAIGADSAAAKAKEGSEVVRDSIQAIDEVREMTDILTTDMNELSTRVESIGQIMSVINDIADQTNLLALNAAIEAARAGDAGRGFAVVADEVRKLAEKTMHATDEVEQAITAIQNGSRKSTEHVGTVGKAVSRATSMVATSGEALNAIVEVAQDVSTKITFIATSVEQQSAATQEIGQGVSDVSRISEETADNARKADHGVQTISSATDKLEELNRSLRQEAEAGA